MDLTYIPEALCLDGRAATSSGVCWLLEASSDADTGRMSPARYRAKLRRAYLYAGTWTACGAPQTKPREGQTAVF